MIEINLGFTYDEYEKKWAAQLKLEDCVSVGIGESLEAALIDLKEKLVLERLQSGSGDKAWDQG